MSTLFLSQILKIKFLIIVVIIAVVITASAVSIQFFQTIPINDFSETNKISGTSSGMILYKDSHPGTSNKTTDNQPHHYVNKKTLFFHNQSLMGEVTRHSPTLKNLDYHVNLITTHSFKSFSNTDDPSAGGSQKVTEDIEFEIYLTKWRFDQSVETKLIDTWSYHSKDHATEYETNLLPGEYVTWQILPIALSEPKFDWERINTETMIEFEFSLIDDD